MFNLEISKIFDRLNSSNSERLEVLEILVTNLDIISQDLCDTENAFGSVLAYKFSVLINQYKNTLIRFAKMFDSSPSDAVFTYSDVIQVAQEVTKLVLQFIDKFQTSKSDNIKDFTNKARIIGTHRLVSLGKNDSSESNMVNALALFVDALDVDREL